jgi:molybdopterin guanine dinucleotide-containing S/N-oxide reductase-like protein
MERKVELKTTEKTVIKSLSLAGNLGGGAPCAVDVKDGKVLRIRPLHFDWKYDSKDFNPWKMQRNGQTLKANLKSVPAPFQLAYKKRTYSPNRIKYPLKRVDWDPQGERNPQNRGKSKYQRISWDEAAELIAGELKRVNKEYGPFSVLAQVDGHGECKHLHSAHGCCTLLLTKMGGYTQQVRNTDSWEGWYWGAKHVWGDGIIGMMGPASNVTKDMTENCDMVLFWGCDPEATIWGFFGQIITNLCFFWAAAGIKQIYVCPDLNYGAAVHADKWIPILPNTDAAMQLAIAYIWINEGLYKKDYVANHTVGFDKFADYVMGKEDEIPKTPEWASTKCEVPEWTIKALAREWAAKITSIAHFYGGSYIRSAYSHEPGRLEVILLAMQGLGGPGVHQIQLGRVGVPRSRLPAATLPPTGFGGDISCKIAKHPDLAHVYRVSDTVVSKQIIPKTRIQDAILNPPISFWGNGSITAPVEDQFRKYTYPIAKEEGGAEIHMVWTDSPCRTTCWNHGNKTIEAMRSPKIECMVAQHPWLENDCLLADIILPVNTTLEVEDLVPNSKPSLELSSVGYQRQAVPPIGESKSDYEAVLEVAKKLGLYDEVTEGKSPDEWLKQMFEKDFGISEFISWEKLKEKDYFVFPIAPDWEKDPPGMRKFYEEPEKNPLPTPSGKLEFYSERLARYFPGDMERSPIPRWVEKSENHDDRLSSERASRYPLLLMSNHGRWRVHAQCDDIPWTREVLTCKVKGSDGYLYEPLWVNPQDAAKRGIKSGDILKIYNERGAVLGGARVWERIMPGVVSIDHGARCDWIIPGELDRGGAINLICPHNTASKNTGAEATSSYLVEVERVSAAQMEKWRKRYPDAFEKEYDPASGLRFNSWIESKSE